MIFVDVAHFNGYNLYQRYSLGLSSEPALPPNRRRKDALASVRRAHVG
jgi:hypothetical protein